MGYKNINLSTLSLVFQNTLSLNPSSVENYKVQFKKEKKKTREASEPSTSVTILHG